MGLEEVSGVGDVDEIGQTRVCGVDGPDIDEIVQVSSCGGIVDRCGVDDVRMSVHDGIAYGSQDPRGKDVHDGKHLVLVAPVVPSYGEMAGAHIVSNGFFHDGSIGDGDDVVCADDVSVNSIVPMLVRSTLKAVS